MKRGSDRGGQGKAAPRRGSMHRELKDKCKFTSYGGGERKVCSGAKSSTNSSLDSRIGMEQVRAAETSSGAGRVVEGEVADRQRPTHTSRLAGLADESPGVSLIRFVVFARLFDNFVERGLTEEGLWRD